MRGVGKARAPWRRPPPSPSARRRRRRTRCAGRSPPPPRAACRRAAGFRRSRDRAHAARPAACRAWRVRCSRADRPAGYRAGRGSSIASRAVSDEPLLGEFVLMQADMHVGGHRHVHHLRIGQFQIGHQLDIFVDRAHLQPRIVALLLADGGDGVALVVMGGKHHGLLGQFQQPVEDRIHIARARCRSGNRCGRCRGSRACRR